MRNSYTVQLMCVYELSSHMMSVHLGEEVCKTSTSYTVLLFVYGLK